MSSSLLHNDLCNIRDYSIPCVTAEPAPEPLTGVGAPEPLTEGAGATVERNNNVKPVQTIAGDTD